jgi:hypothetical protein
MLLHSLLAGVVVEFIADKRFEVSSRERTGGLRSQAMPTLILTPRFTEDVHVLWRAASQLGR